MSPELGDHAKASKHIFAGNVRMATMMTEYKDEHEHDRDTEEGHHAPVRAKETPFFYHGDHLGSNHYVTDARGRVYEHLEYFPFGEQWVEEGESGPAPKYRFTAKEWDAETGLYYFGARYYDPRTSVWISTDPADRFTPKSPTIGLNLYQYALWNPVRLIDVDGLAERNTIFVFDQSQRPKDNGTPGQTYTGVAYVMNNEGIHGPYKVSTYPNSGPNGETPYAMVKPKGIPQGGIPYNNASGHSQSQQQGLNMGTIVTNEDGTKSFDRTVETTGPNPEQDNKPIMKYANFHVGQSDNGNYNSRGSHGCFTIAPDDKEGFFSNFDWNKDNPNTGTSHGNIYMYRGDDHGASQLKSVFEDILQRQQSRQNQSGGTE